MDLYLSRSGARTFGRAPPTRGRTGWRKGPLAGFLAGGLLVSAIFFGPAQEARALEVTASANLPAVAAVSSEPARHPRENTFIKRQWGVEPIYVRQTAAGYMLEFRYKVLDAEKAKPLFERRTKPLLIHAESGAKLIVPTPAKTGALRNSNPPLAGHTYWMYFANPGKLVKVGEHVNIEIGEFRLEGAVVR
jgi:hypothetical protein